MTREVEPNQRPRSFSEDELRSMIREEVAQALAGRDDDDDHHVKLGKYKGPWWVLWTFGWAIFGAAWCIFWWYAEGR